jgi:ABC-type transport system involved in Fe-S cluster assembly fused permease/ATPase subunit
MQQGPSSAEAARPAAPTLRMDRARADTPISSRQRWIVFGIATSFTALAAAIIALLVAHVLTFQMALLMLVALLGLYIGFGVLALAWRLVARLD